MLSVKVGNNWLGWIVHEKRNSKGLPGVKSELTTIFRSNSIVSISISLVQEIKHTSTIQNRYFTFINSQLFYVIKNVKNGSLLSDSTNCQLQSLYFATDN